MTTRLKNYIKVKNNPTLAMVEYMEATHKEMKEKMEKEMKLMREEVLYEMERAIKDFSKNEMMKNVQLLKGDKGDDGHTPEMGIDYMTDADIKAFVETVLEEVKMPKDGEDGEDGEPGKDGTTPQKGIDYPSHEQIKTMVMKEIGDIEVQDGKTPVFGVDYFTKKDQERILATLKLQFPKIEITASDIVSKINSSSEQIDASRIKNLPRAMQKRGKVPLRGGGDIIYDADLSDQCNGSIRTFTMPVNRAIRGVFSTQAPMIYRPAVDWTRNTSGNLVLSNDVDAPATGQTLWVTYIV